MPGLTTVDARTPPAISAAPLTPAAAAPRLAKWGFLARPDFPDGPGSAELLVALRARPTYTHFDPELVEYWLTDSGRGRRAHLTYASGMPLTEPFSWGTIRIVDRLGISNEYLTFGGRLAADRVGGLVVAVFASDAPLLRRGGHSQGWDAGASDLGGFFGRLMVAVDYAPGFEAAVASARPIARYAAFVADLTGRYRVSATLRLAHPTLWRLLATEERRLRRDEPQGWTAGVELLARARAAR